MIEESIDFGNFSKKILVNPIVPLQILDIYFRNKLRVQATILGKVYSNAIEILDIVPISLSEEHKIEKLDFPAHSRALQNIRSVYTSYQIIGVAVTDLPPDNNLAILHTMYSNKDSGFRSQGILTHPLILSIGTKLKQTSENFNIQCYCFNQPYLFCKDLMGITSFEKLDVTISLGDSDIESMAPLFQAINDQEEFIPKGDLNHLLRKLKTILQELKLHCEKNKDNEELRSNVRRILDRLNTKHDYNIEELYYLLDYATLQRKLASKISTIRS